MNLLHPRTLETFRRTGGGKKQKLTSRLMIEDTCAINAGILNSISEVDPFCLTWSFTYPHNRPKNKMK